MVIQYLCRLGVESATIQDMVEFPMIIVMVIIEVGTIQENIYIFSISAVDT